MEKIHEKNIPTINGGFKPSMADISYAMDTLLRLAEAGDQDAQDLYQLMCSNLWSLEDICKIVRNWNKFKINKELKEKKELKKI